VDPRPWTDFAWLNPPAHAHVDGELMRVRTAPDTDFWQVTSYGFVHDNGHALLAPFDGDGAIEVTFEAAYTDQFDQAGVMLHASSTRWLKAGIEFTDGRPYASVVVTDGLSDWSVVPLDVSAAGRVTIRLSRTGEAITVRVGIGGATPEQFLRLTHLPADDAWRAGPFCCSPTGPGLDVAFEPVVFGEPDAHLHAD
jgi:regulation of enolase protein 1 (concanavalin A-like superfamily)